MEKLSDNIQRKFIDSHSVEDYEILTDTGWSDCTAIHKTVRYNIWHLVTETHELDCADTHIVFDQAMNEVFVKDLSVGDTIQTDIGTEKILSISKTLSEDNMYDVELVDDSNHRYYTGGILSHNTTTYTIYALWTLIFQPEKRIMLLANKADTSLEIIDRVRLAYGYLPVWMKPGVVTWNKGEIVFSNRSAIKGFATSSDAARGYSANCVKGNTKITIRLFGFLTITVPIKWLTLFGKPGYLSPMVRQIVTLKRMMLFHPAGAAV